MFFAAGLEITFLSTDLYFNLIIFKVFKLLLLLLLTGILFYDELDRLIVIAVTLFNEDSTFCVNANYSSFLFFIFLIYLDIIPI